VRWQDLDEAVIRLLSLYDGVARESIDTSTVKRTVLAHAFLWALESAYAIQLLVAQDHARQALPIARTLVEQSIDLWYIESQDNPEEHYQMMWDHHYVRTEQFLDLGCWRPEPSCAPQIRIRAEAIREQYGWKKGRQNWCPHTLKQRAELAGKGPIYDRWYRVLCDTSHMSTFAMQAQRVSLGEDHVQVRTTDTDEDRLEVLTPTAASLPTSLVLWTIEFVPEQIDLIDSKIKQIVAGLGLPPVSVLGL